jgi:uncharacterized protein
MNKRWLIGTALVIGLSITSLVGCTSTTPSQPTTTTIINTVTTTAVVIPDANLVGGELNTISDIIAEQQAGIWVSGSGSVTVTPDIVNLNLGVRSQETTVAAAQAKAASAMSQIMSVLKTNNIADKDIQTVQFNINPVYSYNSSTGQNTIIGYSVNNIVNVKIRNINNVGKIIDAVANAGGDLTVINSISFAVDNPEQYYAEARQKAMNDAKTKALQLATLGGVTLGKPIYVTESSVTPTPIYYTKSAGTPEMDGSTQISSGEADITINVSVTFSIN